MTGNASHVILQGTDVYTRDLTITDNLPATSGATLASRDSSRAYVYSDDVAGGGPLQTGALYPLPRTITLADAANANPGTYNSIAMEATPDGKTIFISGNTKPLVVPVN